MKLILTTDVSGLGGAGDMVTVKDGYGRNFLVPQGLAILATRGAEKQVATIKRAQGAREVRDLGHAQEIKSQLESLTVSLPTKAGESGRLFGSVTAGAIADAVKAAGGPVLDKRKVELSTPIKTVGAHEVLVRIHPEVSAKVSLDVVAS